MKKITTKHPQYQKRIAQWRRCRDCHEGEDAVKDRGSEYLPMLKGQSEEEYQAYKMRGLFYGATSRTVDGLVGGIVRKEPVVKMPTAYEPWLDDITSKGVTLLEFIKQVSTELLMTNHVGLLVDRPQEENGRPYATIYCAEAVINWNDDGTRYVLEERKQIEGDDGYKEIVAYRELVLVNGVYVQNLWTKLAQPTPDGSEYAITETSVPNMRGQPLAMIPFIFVAVTGVHAKADKPPIVDLANVNLSHYRSYVDIEHGRHFTALPTPYVTGVDPETVKALNIGSGKAWILPDPSSRCAFLEFTGAGLAALERGLMQKQEQMAILGARLLQGQRIGVEAAETARINQAGEVSVLSSMASSVEQAMEKVLTFMVSWEGATEEVVVDINRDFIDAALQSGDITALVAAWQNGAISHDTLLWNFKRGELLPDERDIEDEKALVENDNATRGAAAEESASMQARVAADAAAAAAAAQGGATGKMEA